MDVLSQHEAFLRAIFDAPDDDTPRLVYADFLQENGEEERAEFIRVQCEMTAKKGLVDEFDQLCVLAAREQKLLSRLPTELKHSGSGDRPGQVRSRFVRGFLPPGERFFVTTATVADANAERWRVVRSEPEAFGAQSLWPRSGVLLNAEQVERLFALPAVQRIDEWHLCGNVREALSHSEPGSFDLTELIQESAITTAGVEALAQHRGARRITSLDLSNNNLDNDAARALVKSPYLDNLKRLRLLEGNQFRGRVWQQVRERFGEDVVE